MSQLFSGLLKQWIADAQESESWNLSRTFRCALIDDSINYTPDPTSEQYVSDVLDGSTASEFTDASYSRQDVSGLFTTTTPTSTLQGLADDIVFPNLSGDTVQGALIYLQVGGDDTTPSDDWLVAYLDGADYPAATNGEDFVVDLNDDGSINDGPVFEINL